MGTYRKDTPQGVREGTVRVRGTHRCSYRICGSQSAAQMCLATATTIGAAVRSRTLSAPYRTPCGVSLRDISKNEK